MQRGLQNAQGVRLGLYIVKHIVDAHGGSLDVRSDHEGTRLTVRLPRRARSIRAHDLGNDLGKDLSAPGSRIEKGEPQLALFASYGGQGPAAPRVALDQLSAVFSVNADAS